MKVDIKEALRYLGCKEENPELMASAGECIDEILNITTPHITYEVYDILVNEGEVKIKNTDIVFKSCDLAKLLKHSKRCVIMAATLGCAVDKRIAFYQKTDMEKAVVFDACASAAVEALCETAAGQIKSQEIVKYLTIRFSPGYGDLSLSYQKEMINLTDSYKKIGLTATSSMLLTPTKSVTAIMGITDTPYMLTREGCENCPAFNDCKYKKGCE